MKHSRLILLLSLALTVAVSLAACRWGSAGEDEVTNGPSESVAGEEVEEGTPAEQAEEEAPSGGGGSEESSDGAPAGSEAGACELVAVLGAVGRELDTLGELTSLFEAQHPGTTVEIVLAAESSTDRLGQYLQDLEQQRGDFDVLQIDVIWPGDLARHLIDLTPYIEPGLLSQHFPAIVENNTVGGELVAVPWFTDVGLLYYRTDLLAKYGYDAPPETWEELEAMARAIQEGERANHPDFAGYVWQGNAYEGLTCNALEWIASHDGGTIVSEDKTITINNENATRAIQRAAGWVGSISPEGVTGFQEEDARNVWQAGNAAFMRHWPYAYGLSFESEALCTNEISAETGRCTEATFNVAPLPRADGAEGAGACLGGWQLAASKYSACPERAAELAVFLASPEAQRLRALRSSLPPSIASLYDEPEVAAVVPPVMQQVLENVTPRPSTATAPNYYEVSSIFFSNVHEVLMGAQNAEEAVAEIEVQLETLLGFPTGQPE